MTSELSAIKPILPIFKKEYTHTQGITKRQAKLKLILYTKTYYYIFKKNDKI